MLFAYFSRQNLRRKAKMPFGKAGKTAENSIEIRNLFKRMSWFSNFYENPADFCAKSL